MLTLIYLSLILFILISSTTSLNDSDSNSCFNFTLTKNNKTNRCHVQSPLNATYQLLYRRTSIQCHIQDVDIEIKRNCSKSIDSAALIFDNNTMFETFFKKNGAAIAKLCPPRRNRSGYYVLDIIINYYNVSKMTYQYIDSTVNINATQTRIFLWFKKHLPDSSPLTVVDEAYPIKFKLLVVNVECDDNTSAHYIVNSSSRRYNKPHEMSKCLPFSTTRHVSFLE